MPFRPKFLLSTSFTNATNPKFERELIETTMQGINNTKDKSSQFIKRLQLDQKYGIQKTASGNGKKQFKTLKEKMILLAIGLLLLCETKQDR